MDNRGPDLLATQLEAIMEQVWQLTGMISEILHFLHVYPEKYEREQINLDDIF